MSFSISDPDSLFALVSVVLLGGLTLVIVLALIQGRFIEKRLMRKDREGYENLSVSDFDPILDFPGLALSNLLAMRGDDTYAIYDDLVVSHEDVHRLRGNEFRGRVLNDEIVDFEPPFDVEVALRNMADAMDARILDGERLEGSFDGVDFMLDVDGVWLHVSCPFDPPRGDYFLLEIDSLPDAGLEEFYDHTRKRGTWSVRFAEDSRRAYERYHEVMDEIVELIAIPSFMIEIDEVEVSVNCEGVLSEPVLRAMLATCTRIKQVLDEFDAGGEPSDEVW